MKKLVIIDYGMGNLWSVMSAIEYLGLQTVISNDPKVISKSELLILPGVGSFRIAMKRLKELHIDEAIYEVLKKEKSKILGICLGMQLLGNSSDEDGHTEGLGIVPLNFKHFDKEVDGKSLKVPHVGFNSIAPSQSKGIFKTLPNNPNFYFVHSYRSTEAPLGYISAKCNYGQEFIAAFDNGKIAGTQFHPEKSQTNGLIMLKNFIEQ
jgi:imidazole glycerol-phosphate synthase subunit HisH|tara:strand:- start:48 stop:671 length:624 start_codon:yes stop_codon:yes gene_type:complete